MDDIEIGSPEYQKLSPAQRLTLLRRKEAHEKQRKDADPKAYLKELRHQRDVLRSDCLNPDDFSIYSPNSNSVSFCLHGPKDHPLLNGESRVWIAGSELGAYQARLDRGRQLVRVERAIDELEQEIDSQSG
jgi:hypothetical protein